MKALLKFLPTELAKNAMFAIIGFVSLSVNRQDAECPDFLLIERWHSRIASRAASFPI